MIERNIARQALPNCKQLCPPAWAHATRRSSTRRVMRFAASFLRLISLLAQGDSGRVGEIDFYK